MSQVESVGAVKRHLRIRSGGEDDASPDVNFHCSFSVGRKVGASGDAATPGSAPTDLTYAPGITYMFMKPLSVHLNTRVRNLQRSKKSYEPKLFR